MKVPKKALWESGGSLQRFGLLRFTGKSIAWKAGRIHRGATKVIESLREDQMETFNSFAEDDEQINQNGQLEKTKVVRAKDKKAYTEAWAKVLADDVEFWGEPFTPDELPTEFWGQEEERDPTGKIIKPAIPAMMTGEDIGALGEWMIQGEATETERTAPVTSIADHQAQKEQAA